MQIPDLNAGPSSYLQNSTSIADRHVGSTTDATSGRTNPHGATPGPDSSAGIPVDVLSLNTVPSSVTETHVEKLARLQDAISNGTYGVSSSVLADKLIKAGVVKREGIATETA